MAETLYHLVYLSKAKKLMQEDELFFLLEQSRKNNLIKEVTGMLLYMEGRFLNSLDGRFLQVLEGRKADVHDIYDVIKKDDRHLGLIVLSEGAQDGRYFQNWAMGFQSLGENTAYPGFIDPDSFFASPDRLSHQIRMHTLMFLQSFYDMNNEQN